MSTGVRGSIRASLRAAASAAALLLLPGCMSSGRVVHVAVAGADPAATGTASRPFTSLPQAVDRAEPGDIIQLGPGTFYETVRVSRSGRQGKPIVIRGTLDPDGRRLTRIHAGELVDPASWEPAPDIGPGVFRNRSLPFEPHLLMIDGRKVAHVYRTKDVAVEGQYGAVSRGDLPADHEWRSMAMEVLAWPEDHREKTRYLSRRHDVDIPFWETMGAVFAHDPDPEAGITYLRIAGGSDPRERDISIARGEPVVSIDDASFIELRDLDIAGGDVGVAIQGPEATHNLVENCRVTHARSRVHITGEASHTTIRNCDMTMEFYGDTAPGPWSGGSTEAHARREYLYNFFKYLHGRGTTSDDRSIHIDGDARHTRVEDNHIDSGLVGIAINDTRDALIRGNRVANHSSVGISVRHNTLDVHLEANRIHDNSINIRLHNLNHGDGRRVYIYGNLLSYSEDLGSHIFCHAMPLREHRPPDVWLYHNTFARGARVFSLPSPRLMPEGVPGFRLLNNVLAPRGRSIGGGATTLGNVSGVGLFAYNWAGADLPEIEIAWLGEGNVLVPGEHPWPTDGEPRFALPEGHTARHAGIDLSRPFRIGDDVFDPLPGMTPGYFPGERPDMGAVQHPLNAGPKPES